MPSPEPNTRHRIATPARAHAESAPSGPGFRWDDAAIGAGAALVLVGTGGAVAGGARRRRMRRALAG
jgi:hypothetical protein